MSSHPSSPLFDSPMFNGALFFPRRDRSSPANARNLRVAVEPGVDVHLRIHDRPGPIVLLFHGNGEVVADYDGAADLYAQAGAALAVADYRGYGESSGRPTLRSCITDAPVVLDALQNEAGGRPIVVMGRSIGGSPAAEVCKEEREGVVGYIFESAAADVVGLLRRRGLRLDGELTADERAVFDPLPKMRRCTKPTLVLHGAQDTLIEPVEARLSAEALRTEAVLIPGRGHNDLSFHPLYWEALAGFLARVAG